MKLVLPVTLCVVAATVTAGAQAPTSMSGGSSRASSSLQSSPFLGGVPAGTVTAEPLSITVIDAINRALEHNLGLLNAQESIGFAEGSRRMALADLLPNASAHVSEVRQKVNLAAFGFPLPAGIPPVVGPFNVFDVRASVTQTLFDARAINETHAQSHNLTASQYNVRSARDLVVLVAGNLYLQALAADARVQSSKAQLQTAQAIFEQATHLKEAGIVPGIDVLRAEVQLGSDRQRATAASSEFEKSKLQLARVMGLPAGQAFTLSQDLPYLPTPDITLEQALDQAYKTRPDYMAAQERLAAAEATRRAASGELLPTVKLSADYGRIGLTPGDGEQTYTLLGSLNVPIFNGGRSRGRLMEADADLRMRRSELEDMKAGVDFDVRSAFLDLKSSDEQFQVATRSRDLAAQQLTQARDRFAAGVASNIEVVQAQEAVATSSEQYIGALYSYNIAKALLARGMGVAEAAARQYLGGVR